MNCKNARQTVISKKISRNNIQHQTPNKPDFSQEWLGPVSELHIVV